MVVFGSTAGVAFSLGAKADAYRFIKLIPIDSAKSQKQITLSGEEIFWVSSDIVFRVSSTDDDRTEAVRTLVNFRGRHKTRNVNSADSKAA